MPDVSKDSCSSDIWKLTSDYVSRETLSKLEAYVELLLKWNQSINLIGRSTESEIWHRHILDSLQLIKYLPDRNVSIIDLGSGAGLPGAVLALCGYSRVTLVEKNSKKATFLRNVSRETLTSFQVIEKDIKEVTGNYDVVTSRGLTELSMLLEMSYPLLKKRGQCLFLKGERVDDEIFVGNSHAWKMTMTKKESITNPRASLLLITHLERAPEKNE